MDVVSQLERGAIAPRFAATLCAQLPSNARVNVARDEDALWGISEAVLVSIDYDLRALMYSLGGGKGKKPKPIHEFGKKDKANRVVTHADGTTDEMELVEIPDLEALALRLTSGGEDEDGDG